VCPETETLGRRSSDIPDRRGLLRHTAGRHQRGEAGGPGGGSWALVEPGDRAVDVDRGGRRDVLQVRLLETPQGLRMSDEIA
jgi:hypothetical protein